MLAGGAAGAVCLAQEAAKYGSTQKPAVRIGLIADVHYADKKPVGTRHYRDSIEKMRRAVAKLNDSGVDLAIELGDLIDAAGGTVEAEIGYLKRIEAEFAELKKVDRHYVLGNHCVHTLTKAEFIENCAAKDRCSAKQTHYSFDAGGFHLVVLDSCYRSDGEPYRRANFDWRDTNIPKAELDWLETDLKKSGKPTIVFAHQRLDDTEYYTVKNAAAVRGVLESFGSVLAVFQGHSHKNAHVEVNGIHYCVVRGMVEGPGLENNGFAKLEVFRDGSMTVRGFAKQTGYRLT